MPRVFHDMLPLCAFLFADAAAAAIFAGAFVAYAAAADA